METNDDYLMDIGWPWSETGEDWMPTWRWRLSFWLGMKWGRLLYRLGLTHQFSCKVCGWPMLERRATTIPGLNHWRWYCSSCGAEHVCTHAPRILKHQHRIVVTLRLLWKEIRCRQPHL